jgi:hypothetical protein
MALLNQEAWMSDYKETLNLEASFLSRMTDLGAFVNNEFIHFPNAGALTKSMTENQNTFPLSFEQRTDSTIDIKMTQFSTTPVLITDLESFQVSADKRNSVVGQKNREVIEYAGDKVFSKIIAGVDAAHTVTYTDTLTFEDIVKVQALLDMDNVPQADRSLELTVEQYYQLAQDPKVLPMYASGLNVVQSGSFLEIAGIKLYKRPRIATVAGKMAGIAYHKGSVGAAVSSIKTFVQYDHPLYLGTILTNAMWLGAGVLRTDKKGVVALVKA